MLHTLFTTIFLLLSSKGSTNSFYNSVEGCNEYTTILSTQGTPFRGAKAMVKWDNSNHLLLFRNTRGAGFVGKCNDQTCTNPVLIEITPNQYCPYPETNTCDGAIAVDNQGNAAITYYSSNQKELILKICTKNDLEANICTSIPPITILSNSTQGYANSLEIRNDLITVNYPENTGDIKYFNCNLSSNCSNPFNITIHTPPPSTILDLFLVAPNLTHTYTTYITSNYNIYLIFLSNMNGTSYEVNIIDSLQASSHLHMILVNSQLLIGYTENSGPPCWRVAKCQNLTCSNTTLSTQTVNCGLAGQHVTLSKAQGGFDIYHGGSGPSYRVTCRNHNLICTNPSQNYLANPGGVLFSASFHSGIRSVFYYNQYTSNLVIKGCIPAASTPSTTKEKKNWYPTTGEIVLWVFVGIVVCVGILFQVYQVCQLILEKNNNKREITITDHLEKKLEK